MTTIHNMLAVVLVTVMLAMSPLFLNQVNAQIVTEQQIAQQNNVARDQLRVTLVEHVKLLQMILIQHLEARLAQLQAQQAEQEN